MVECLQGTSHQMLEECSATLFLALQHPDKHIRLLAVKKVVAQLAEGNLDDEQFEDFIKDALLERLMDDSRDIVALVLQISDVLLDKIEPEPLFKQLSNIVTRTHLPSFYLIAIYFSYNILLLRP